MAKVQAEEDALRVARVAADQQNKMVEGARQLLFVLAQMPVIRAQDPAACSAFLSRVKIYNTRFTNILKTDLDGRILCDSISSHFSGRVPDDGFIQHIVETQSFTIGNYVISPTTNQPAIGFGYPILNEQGQVQAVLVAGLALNSLDELFTRSLMPPKSIFALRDRNGTILAHYPDPEKWIGRSEPIPQISQAITAKKGEGTIEAIGLDGVPTLYAFASLPSAPSADVYISVGIPKDIAFAEVNQALKRNLATLGLVAVLAFAVAWVFSDLFILRQLRAMLETTKGIAAGHLETRTGLRDVGGELGKLAQAFDQMGSALEKREKERREVHEALIREEEARARLLHKLITAHEDERIRIARELHDETSQSLTALMVGFDTACLALGKDSPKAKERLEFVKGIAEGMLSEIHRLISDLRPSSLDDLGLVPTILSYGKNRLGSVGISLQLHEEGLNGRLPPILETALFRILQEAFTNIIRHSCASKVDVWLAFTDKELLLRVADDGKGFDATLLSTESQGEGFGLQGMQERVRMLDGIFEIITAPGEGTEIIIRIPVTEGVLDYA
jgi:signal transduction histidine kinase